MILELCVTELEDVASDTESGRNAAQPVVQVTGFPSVSEVLLCQRGFIFFPHQS